MKRPDCIKHFSEIQSNDDCHYPQSSELLCYGSPLGKAVGLKKIGIHHEILPPGRRTSWPHAESEEEEFAYVIEGEPHVWIDGNLFQLKSGDAVGFPSGTGISHTFINNTNQNVRLLVVGEANKSSNKIYYPLHPQRKEQVGDGWWDEVPKHTLGPHDGLPDKLRTKKP
jgi:uncharacterized cupin superfamily protein